MIIPAVIRLTLVNILSFFQGNFRRILYAILLIAVILLFTMTFTCCKTFKPVWNDKLPPECNMAMNVLSVYYTTQDKSATMPSLDYCYKCLTRLRCQGDVFGMDKDGKLNPVDYNDPKKYRDYSQCAAELK